MISILQENREQIAALCRRYRVRRLEVFGSAATDRFDKEASDVDFLVEFHALEPGERAEAYFGLLEALQTLLGRSVDLVTVRAIQNPYFLQAIERTRQVVYAA